jgi:hypothetical protein
MASTSQPAAITGSEDASSPPQDRARGQIQFLSDGVAISFENGRCNADPQDSPPKTGIDAAAYCIALLQRHSELTAFDVHLEGKIQSLLATITIRDAALRKLPVLWDMFVVR